jgi:hypothetical protein
LSKYPQAKDFLNKIYVILVCHLQLRTPQHLSPIKDKCISINMPTRPGAQKHHSSSNILRLSEPPIRTDLTQLLYSATLLHKRVRHLGGEEAWRDAVNENVARPEFDGKVPCEVQDGGFAGRIGVGSVFTEQADCYACYGAGDYYARGCGEGCVLFEKGSEPVSIISVFSLNLSWT